MMQRRAYPYDLTDEQYHLIADLLPTEKPAGAPGRTRSHSNRELLNAILYHLQVGGSWRSLPHDLPHWNSVYTYFRRWSVDGTLERVQEVLRRRLREKVGKKPEPSVTILDSQSVKSTERGGEKLATSGEPTDKKGSKSGRASATMLTSTSKGVSATSP